MASNLTASLPGDPGGSGSWIASWRVSRGFGLTGLGVLRALISREALDLEMRQVLVLAVVAEPEESLREELKFESCDGFLVISQEEALRFGSSSLSGMPQ